MESSPVAEEAMWIEHASRFVTAFVVPARRDRWRWLLLERPRRIGRDSHKLHSDLDPRFCQSEGVLPPEVLTGEGLYYPFADLPRVVPASSIDLAVGNGDAIFSLVPGKLAVYFFHEGEIWLCRAQSQR